MSRVTNKQRTTWYGLFFVVGIVAVALSAFGIIDDTLGACGITLSLIAALQLFKAVRYAKDPEFAKTIDVSNADERLAFLAGKSAQSAFQVSVVALLLSSLALRFFGKGDTADVLGFVAFGEVIVYWVSYLVVSRRY